MSKQQNPITLGKTGLDLLPTIQTFTPAYGRIADSGLFKGVALNTDVAMWKIEQQENARMTKLTSYHERDATRVGAVKEKWVTVGALSLKKTGSVKVEDLRNRYFGGAFDLTATSVQDKIIERTRAMYNTYSQEKEWLLLTTSQGKTKDLSGNIITDLFAETGTTQSTLTIDASPSSTTLISGLQTLSNMISNLNGWYGVVGGIEVVVAEDVFNAIETHPEFVTAAQLAFTGMGSAAMNNPLFLGQASTPEYTRYGNYRVLRWQNLVITTYPQTFRTLNDQNLTAVPNGKGWTIARGVDECYELGFVPAPYFSTIGREGQEIYARSTGVVDDTHIDITIESHLMPMMKRPELSIDLTFTLT